VIQIIKRKYEHTIYACYIGYITQAIINNLAPLLFLTFQDEFQLSLGDITLITTVNFLVQLCTDLIAVKFIDKIGYRVAVVTAHILSALGLIGMAVLPGIVGDFYLGLMVSVVCYAIGGGLIEVLISPIVEACPTQKKEATMSLLHSFYCWGHVAVVLFSTAFFYVIGIHHWRILACIWAVVPFLNVFYFLLVPIYDIVPGNVAGLVIRQLLRRKVFWILLLLMVCAGASEQAMSQWSSSFAESGLGVSKAVGDLAGPCTFALLMGIARALYGKFSDYIQLNKVMVGCCVLCFLSYLLAALSQNAVFGFIGCALCGFSVGIFWPGTFSIATKAITGGGTAMFALMALAGDLGCASGPTMVGLVASSSNGDLTNGLLVAIVFPVVLLAGLLMIRRKQKSI
jgi:fucose permease